jgi:lipopolysaccharide transport system permease protein
MTAGLAWVLAALGVFVRDIGHAVLLGTQVLFFATPIFYSIERVPPEFRSVMLANPLTHVVHGARAVMIHGSGPDWAWWGISLGGSSVLAVLGYAFFVKAKRAFSDVI